MINDIIAYCKSLRLSSFFAENSLTAQGNTNQEYLLNLLKSELEYREEKRRNLCLKQAGFDVTKTFANYEFNEIEIPETLSIEAIKSVDFINKVENLIFYGKSGTGKSHLAAAIGVEACMQGKRVKFYSATALVNDLVDSKKKGKLVALLKKLSSIDLLICDEWGYIPFDSEGAQLLFQVISECYEKRSVIITTNLEFSKWNGIFYDEKLTNALIDRLVHHSHLLVFPGESYRLKHSIMQKNI